MDKFNLPAALLAYRTEHNLTIRSMADKLNMSKSAYDRLEKGLTKPTYEEVPGILNLLDIEVGSVNVDTKPPVKWYRSKMWRWVLPIIYSYLLMDLMVTVSFSDYIDGEQIIHDKVPYFGLTIIGASLVAIYWAFLPPPTRWIKPLLKKLTGKIRRIFHRR